MKKLLLEIWYRIVEPLFGAAYAAPNKGSTILYWSRVSINSVSPAENSKFKDLVNSRTFKDLKVIFQYFSRQI